MSLLSGSIDDKSDVFLVDLEIRLLKEHGQGSVINFQIYPYPGKKCQFCGE